jgi:1-acyl-sn-glycerol-3-phosphate acyltransferase
MIEPILDRSMSPARRWKHVLFVCARFLVIPVLRVLIRLRIRGVSNVPASGGAIVICNHLGWFDPLLLIAASPRPILFMAKEEVLAIRGLSWIARRAGAFPVRRGRPDRTALRHAQARLDDGLLVGMYPEGTRSTTGGLTRPYDGASLIAVRSGVPIIPCAVIGSEVLPGSGVRSGRRLSYPRITVVFGEAFMLVAENEDGSKRQLSDLSEAMMNEIARLLPERYRGIYLDNAGTRSAAVSRDHVQFAGVRDR